MIEINWGDIFTGVAISWVIWVSGVCFWTTAIAPKYKKTLNAAFSKIRHLEGVEGNIKQKDEWHVER